MGDPKCPVKSRADSQSTIACAYNRRFAEESALSCSDPCHCRRLHCCREYSGSSRSGAGPGVWQRQCADRRLLRCVQNPNFLRRLFAEGAFATAFVPVLTEYRSKREYGNSGDFVDHVAGSLGLVTLAVSLIGVVAARPGGVAVRIRLGDGRRSGQTRPGRGMLRLTFPYLFFISLTAFAGSIINARSLRRAGIHSGAAEPVPDRCGPLASAAMMAQGSWRWRGAC